MKQLTALAVTYYTSYANVARHTTYANVARQAAGSCEQQHLVIKRWNVIDQIDCRLEPT